MNYMFRMNNRMTIWTYHNNIFLFIIFSVLIFMMQSKNFFIFIKSTYFAILYPSSQKPCFSNIYKITICFWFSLIFSSTFRSAKFIFFARRSHEFFLTCSAFIFNRSSAFLRPVIAKFRTIFCFIASRRNMFKLFSANFTSSFSFYSRSQTLASSRAIFEFFQSIFGKIFFFPTKNTFNIRRFHYAFI